MTKEGQCVERVPKIQEIVAEVSVLPSNVWKIVCCFLKSYFSSERGDTSCSPHLMGPKLKSFIQNGCVVSQRDDLSFEQRN